MNLDDGERDTLGEAKKQLRANFSQGSNCPCCGQFVKKYRRRITTRTAIGLIKLYKLDKKLPGQFFHVDDIFSKGGSGEFATSMAWGLTERKANDDETKQTSGFYKLTERGKAFVYAFAKVSKYAYFFNNKLLGFDGDQVSIKDCLKVQFNYKELMRDN